MTNPDPIVQAVASSEREHFVSDPIDNISWMLAEAIAVANRAERLEADWNRERTGRQKAEAERDNAVARAEAAEATVARVRALFSGGPDTPCRTAWRESDWQGMDPIECVEVPLMDLRAALDKEADDDRD